MIYDKIENIAKYRGISKWFDQAVDFISKTDLTSLLLGRTEICENHVFVNVMEVDTKNDEDVLFEFHKKYWDIHIDIEGIEKVQIGLESGEVMEEYSEENDFGTLSNGKYLECVVEQGCFLVCLQEEPHKPTLRSGECTKIKKCVFKIEVEGCES